MINCDFSNQTLILKLLQTVNGQKNVWIEHGKAVIQKHPSNSQTGQSDIPRKDTVSEITLKTPLPQWLLTFDEESTGGDQGYLRIFQRYDILGPGSISQREGIQLPSKII